MKYLPLLLVYFSVSCWNDEYNSYQQEKLFLDRAAAEQYILGKDCYIEEING